MCRMTLIALAWLFVASAASAKEISKPYFAQTIVTGTVEPERTRGFQAGLRDVFVKLTGDVALAESPLLEPATSDPHRFVESFEYEDRMKGIPVHDEQGTRERPHFLRINFKPEEIEKELKRLNLARWSTDRPILAVWLGVEAANGRYVLEASGYRGFGQRSVIVETAERRGIPIVLPSGHDAAMHVDFDNIENKNIQKLKATAPSVDAVLCGVLSVNENGYWNMDWVFAWKDRSQTWSLQNVSFDTALKDGLHTYAEILSRQAESD